MIRKIQRNKLSIILHEEYIAIFDNLNSVIFESTRYTKLNSFRQFKAELIFEYEQKMDSWSAILSTANKYGITPNSIRINEEWLEES